MTFDIQTFEIECGKLLIKAASKLYGTHMAKRHLTMLDSQKSVKENRDKAEYRKFKKFRMEFPE